MRRFQLDLREEATPRPWHVVLLFLSAMGTAFILIWLFKYSAYGLDFTDESFYLVWLSNPFIYNGSTTQFGYVYHPLYVLLDGDIASLRRANIVITFGLGWWLTYSFLSSLSPASKQERLVIQIASSGIATSSLVLFDTWMTTPSYNSLGFQALLICSIGLLRAEKMPTRSSLIGWSLIALGGWLAFMAKPSTALALAIGIFGCLIVSRKASLPMLAVAVAIAIMLLVLSAIYIDGSVAAFANRVALGLEYARLMGGGHDLANVFRLDEFYLHKRGKFFIFVVLVGSCLGMWGVLTKRPQGPALSLVVCICLFLVISALCLGHITATVGMDEFQGLLMFGVMLAAMVSALVLTGKTTFAGLTRAQLTVAILFLTLPHIYAFGTNRNYWVNGAWAGIFWVLAGITMLGPFACRHKSWRFALPLAIATQAVTAVLLQTGMQQPQRQPQPLSLNDVTLDISSRQVPITLSSSYASYLSAVITLVKANDFKPDTPVIDLSGQSPGVLYAIGAKSVGLGWMIGGYPGSQQLVKAALSQVPCEDIATSWILLEAEGPRSIPAEILKPFGVAFPQGFKKIGTWRTPKGAGGYEDARTQELYSPMETERTLSACRTFRLGKIT
ncbi:hypothetical protein [Agrobacterium cavarae]|uniref:hypothetical protein n=1 Tax=Agrobacterium cavarae TaxID=2528239 RepID=UPI003FD2FDC6